MRGYFFQPWKTFLFAYGIFMLMMSCSSPKSAKVNPWDYLLRDQNQEYPEVDPVKVRGSINIAGSSTLYPLNEVVAQKFQSEGYTGEMTVDSIGSGAGFERWVSRGETDISAASRKITSREREAARKITRESLAFRVGTDALVVVVSRENSFVDSLTKEELALVFSGVKFWSQVRPQWPKIPIRVFSPGTDSGTFDYFVEHIFGGDPNPLLRGSSVQFSEDDNLLVRGVSASEGGIGYFGYSYYVENKKTLRVLGINGIFPTSRTVEEEIYPLSRPLYLYCSQNILDSRPQVGAFLGYYLSVVREESVKAGYFPLSKTLLNTTWDLWKKSTGWVKTPNGWTNFHIKP